MAYLFRHWNASMLCEAIHHIKNIKDIREEARWKKRWSSDPFLHKLDEMEKLVEDQTKILLAEGSLELCKSSPDPKPRPRRVRKAATARKSSKKSASRRVKVEEDSDYCGSHN